MREIKPLDAGILCTKVDGAKILGIGDAKHIANVERREKRIHPLESSSTPNIDYAIPGAGKQKILV